MKDFLMGRLDRVLTGGVIAIGLISSAYANPIPIDQNPTIVIGDKTFSNWTCGVTSNLPELSTCADLGIGVEGHVSTIPPDPTAGDLGVRITGNLFAVVGVPLDVQITYQGATDGTRLFHDASLWFNGTIVTNVNETIQNLDPTSPFYLDTVVLAVHNPPPLFTDQIVLPWDTQFIGVTKDIGLSCLESLGCTGQATISIIDQQFSQTTPEPATLALLGVGLAAAGWFGRRKRA